SRRPDALRLVLDNVNEGLFTIDRAGALCSEYSATLSTWFGPPEPGEVFQRYWARQASGFGAETQLAWEQVIDGWLPLDLALEQMPHQLLCAGRQYDVRYKPIVFMLADRSGFVSFLSEASEIVSRVTSAQPGEPGDIRRAIHTLKGNALLFGLETVADACHEIESALVQEQAPPDPAQLRQLEQRWSKLRTD